MELHVNEGYESVAEVLQKALNQTQSGKGKDRHANDEAFENQKIMQGARTCGLGGPSFQVSKKITEAQRQAEEGDYQGAYANIEGAIIYAVAQYLRTEELEKEHADEAEKEYFNEADVVEDFAWENLLRDMEAKRHIGDARNYLYGGTRRYTETQVGKKVLCSYCPAKFTTSNIFTVYCPNCTTKLDPLKKSPTTGRNMAKL